jgi:hypothetical protein
MGDGVGSMGCGCGISGNATGTVGVGGVVLGGGVPGMSCGIGGMGGGVPGMGGGVPDVDDTIDVEDPRSPYYNPDAKIIATSGIDTDDSVDTDAHKADVDIKTTISATMGVEEPKSKHHNHRKMTGLTGRI